MTSPVTSRIIEGVATDEPTPPTDNHEIRFHALIDYAEEISNGFDRLLIASGNDQPWTRLDMPNGLLFELEYLCRLQLDAACHDLRHRWLSHAAPTHLRPLLEGLAQIAFVLGHETEQPVGTAEQRATCLALARVREEHDAMTATSPDSVPDRNIAEGQERIAILEELHARIGCPYPEDVRAWPCRKEDGTSCDHRSVWPCRVRPAAARKLTTPTIRGLTKRMNHPFRDQEIASSLVLHMLLADRLWVDTGHGTNAFAPAAYAMRASTLSLAFSAYALGAGLIMDTISAPAGYVLRDYLSAMWTKPDLVEIATGAWDKSNAG